MNNFCIPFNEMKDFLNEKVEKYNRPEFIETDPIQIPKSFSSFEDIEISGFLSSVIAWGQRKSIIKNAKKIMDLMGNAPYDFIKNHKKNDLEQISGSIHRNINQLQMIIYKMAFQILRNYSLQKLLFLGLINIYLTLKKALVPNE